ncbi:hypothetical protein PITC_019720 [Penicillium italicum]|uniref:Uncharacterized protein n=1 Tax=Penicillium italicum TaxID=40296 RepID=A0A0A2L348_PENIT|nr:hypothetical protein PITC_019720 [Penicillium italicum]
MCLNLDTDNCQQRAEDQSNIPAQVMTLAPKGLYHILTGFTRACNSVAHRQKPKIRTPQGCELPEIDIRLFVLRTFSGRSSLFVSS